MALIGLGVFATALATAIFVFWVTLVPALPRIGELLACATEFPSRPQPVKLRAVAAPIRREAARMPTPAWRAAA